MTTDNPEKLRLQLLVQSQQRLQLAREQQWSQLEATTRSWDQKLAEALQTYPDALQQIIPQLTEDNDELMRIVADEQQKINIEHRDMKRNMSQTKQYLK